MSLTGLTLPRNDHDGHGDQATYPYTFRINSKFHLKVTELNDDEEEIPLTVDTHFVVTGVGNDNGGTVTRLAGNLPEGHKLTFRRVVPNTQEFDIRNQGSYYPEDHEDAHDYGRMVDHQQQDEINRSFKVAETSDPNFDATIPPGQPNQVLTLNETNSGLSWQPLTTTAAQLATQLGAEEGSDNENYMSPLRTKQQISARISSQAESEAGIDNFKLMTPLRASQSFDFKFGPAFNSKLASQLEAEAAVENSKFMSPLRTREAFHRFIEEFALRNWVAGVPAAGFGGMGAIAFANNLWVGLAPTLGRVALSRDGHIWTNPGIAVQANSWEDMAFDPVHLRYIAVASTGTNRVITTPDGANFTNQNASEASAWRFVECGNGITVAIATSGTNRIMVSSDGGVNWTSVSAFNTLNFMGLCFGNGIFLAVGIDLTDVYAITSSDGVNWTSHLIAPIANVGPGRVMFGKGKFVMVGMNDDGKAMGAISSDNGATWQLLGTDIFHPNVTFFNQGNSCCFGGDDGTFGDGVFVAVGGSNLDPPPPFIYYSRDGENWTPVSGLTVSSLVGVLFGSGRFVNFVNGSAVSHTLTLI